MRIYNINGTDYMTINGASRYLNIARCTVYTYIKLGYFTTLKIDRLYFIEFSELKSRRDRLKQVDNG
jgi:hypothetical protein